MDKKALSPVIATVLLISLALILAGIIFAWGSSFMAGLSPPVDCGGVNFRAEILNSSNSLEIVNLDAIQIEGFVIKEFGVGELITKEEIDYVVTPGNTTSIELIENYESGTFLIIPKIAYGDDEDIGICNDAYGFEVEI